MKTNLTHFLDFLTPQKSPLSSSPHRGSQQRTPFHQFTLNNHWFMHQKSQFSLKETQASILFTDAAVVSLNVTITSHIAYHGVMWTRLRIYATISATAVVLKKRSFFYIAFFRWILRFFCENLVIFAGISQKCSGNDKKRWHSLKFEDNGKFKLFESLEK